MAEFVAAGDIAIPNSFLNCKISVNYADNNQHEVQW